MKKLLSTFLALIMTVSVFTVLFTANLTVSATKTDSTETTEEPVEEDTSLDILKQEFKTPEDKLAYMTMRMENENFQLYTRARYGEIALKDKRTGQILFSNPYDIASSKGDESTKKELMSQIILKFTTGSNEKTFTSYTDAALREQIIVKNIKNGIRVEYTMGKTEARYLVPQMIENERFYEMIINPMLANTAGLPESERNFIIGKFENGFYLKKDIKDSTLTATSRSEMIHTWPVLEKLPSGCLWVIGPDTKDREYNMLEGYIKTYCPDYSYEQLDYDHELCEYEETATQQPLFRMAIEYTLDETGMIQTFAANSLRFDESSYKLQFIKVNPWFGAGNSTYKGITLIPDGSGEISRFEDDIRVTLTGKIYGTDFAYHDNGLSQSQVMRLPVYGTVENYEKRENKWVVVELPEEEWYYDIYGTLIKTKNEMQTVISGEDRGYFAIMLEGDSLAEITQINDAGRTHDYALVQTTYYPRPTDEYNLADAISVGANATWTVTSKRKYTGNYTTKYFMLSDEDKIDEYKAKQEEYANDNDETTVPDNDSIFYPANYMGMVAACRDYYEDTGILTRLKTEDIKEEIPLVIEALGAIDAEERILSVPVTVKVPLTTFDNIKDMYNVLSTAGITNINFKLTGFANGGLSSTVPYNLKWEKKVGGANGFEDLMSFAKDKGINIYPEFDFTYVGTSKLFDGFNYKQHAVKTMDNRYPSKYEYDPARQTITRTWYNPISASVFDYFYTKFGPKLLEYAPSGISVASLGSDLNSDFDKKDSYNREECKNLIVKLLARMESDFGSVMIDGGNAYALKYADYILNVPLDSSQYTISSASIPFMGMVLHGYVNFTGPALNMAGDIDSEILKAIENGASPYFLLAYQNTDKLKENFAYKKYYSVSFTTWAEAGLIEKYNILNGALKDVQDQLIIGHEFLSGERVLTAEELAQREEDERRQEEEESIAQSIEDAKTETSEVTTVEGETATDADITGEGTDAPEEDGTTAAETDAEPSETGDETTAPEEDPENPEEPEINPDDLVENDKIVKVTYENGKEFILNYNNYAVRVILEDGTSVEIAALGFHSYYVNGGNA